MGLDGDGRCEWGVGVGWEGWMEGEGRRYHRLAELGRVVRAWFPILPPPGNRSDKNRNLLATIQRFYNSPPPHAKTPSTPAFPNLFLRPPQVPDCSIARPCCQPLHSHFPHQLPPSPKPVKSCPPPLTPQNSHYHYPPLPGTPTHQPVSATSKSSYPP